MEGVFVMAGNIQTLQKWGNSLGIRIPKTYLDELSWGEDTQVRESVVGGKLVIEAVTTPKIPKYKLKELLGGVTPETRHEEVDFGEPVGREIW